MLEGLGGTYTPYQLTMCFDPETKSINSIQQRLNGALTQFLSGQVDTPGVQLHAEKARLRNLSQSLAHVAPLLSASVHPTECRGSRLLDPNLTLFRACTKRVGSFI